MNIRMFIPACGLGTRVAELGIKPHLTIRFPEKPETALERVMDMAPKGVPIEIALLGRYGCPAMSRDVTVRFFQNETLGQADTIRQWIHKYKPAERWLLISNCDNWIDHHAIADAITTIERTGNFMRGVVFTFKPIERDDLRYSYCLVDSITMRIIKTYEKEKPTSHACTGVYLLRTSELRRALSMTSDQYLSAAFDFMSGLYAAPVNFYKVWGTPEQIQEVEAGQRQKL